MGLLVEGQWKDTWYEPDEEGRFQRPETVFRDKIAADPSSRFPAEKDRYHLFVSYACPWAHRTLIARRLLGLESVIDYSAVHWHMTDEGWHFDEKESGATPDKLFGSEYLRQVYVRAHDSYTGRVTVPVLWDKKEATIVNNESREIIRMLSRAFRPSGHTERDLAPEELTADIDEVLDAIYEPINNGVYRAGFATTQKAYNEAVDEVFKALDHWDKVLGTHRFLVGDSITEADICLFTTLYRFDMVYVSHFKCDLRRIIDYENLWGFVRDIYQTPGVADTCRADHIKGHYFKSHLSINPTGIIPAGPILDFSQPHGRQHL